MNKKWKVITKTHCDVCGKMIEVESLARSFFDISCKECDEKKEQKIKDNITNKYNLLDLDE